MTDPADPTLLRFPYPVHRVSVDAFFAGANEVRRAHYKACVDDGACSRPWIDPEFEGPLDKPVQGVSWDQTQEYIGWLSTLTGQNYRLLSESEWEYVARAGTNTRYWWGDEEPPIPCDFGSARGATYAACLGNVPHGTSPVGSYGANPFGIHDAYGNLSEWVQDCENRSYEGAPENGEPWLEGNCNSRMYRGDAYEWGYGSMVAWRRYGGAKRFQFTNNGFRVARD